MRTYSLGSANRKCLPHLWIHELVIKNYTVTENLPGSGYSWAVTEGRAAEYERMEEASSVSIVPAAKRGKLSHLMLHDSSHSFVVVTILVYLGWAHIDAMVCMWRSDSNLQEELVLSLSRVGTGSWTQDARLVGKYLYSLSHLVDQIIFY